MYTLREGFFRPYSDLVFSRFFERALEIDVPTEVAKVIDHLHGSGDAYLDYAQGDGRAAFRTCMDEAATDQIFGVPTFVLRGELFWGYDRLPLLEERLTELGLTR